MVSQVNSRALITGASSGIGRATALAFATAGFDVGLIGRSVERLQSVAAEVAPLGVQASPYALDLANLAQVKDGMAAIAVEFGPVDVLVNNAGMGYTGDLLSTTLEDWQHVINLNLTSVFLCIQGILPAMRDRGRGTIINVSSIAGEAAFPGWGAYNVSKAGLNALSKTWAAEERDHGIRVVTIAPGAVNTSIWDTDTVQANFDRSKMLSPETVAQTILHMALLPPQAMIPELTITPSAGAL